MNGSSILGPWEKYENTTNFHEIVQWVQTEFASHGKIEKRNNGDCDYLPGACDETLGYQEICVSCLW
jgi:hypothetical protein